MGLFSRRKKEDEFYNAESKQRDSVKTSHSSAPAPTEQTAPKTPSPSQQELSKGSGLYAVVEKMRRKGQGELTLELTQEGNDMNLSFFENSQAKEQTVVIPGNEWFESIAKLYTDETKNGGGAFNRALIVVTGETNYRVQASFMNTEKNTTTNTSYGAPAPELDDDQEETYSPESVEDGLDSASRFELSDRSAQSAAPITAQDRLKNVSARIDNEPESDSAESFGAIAFGEERRQETEPRQDIEPRLHAERNETFESAEAGETEEVPDHANPFVSEEEQTSELDDAAQDSADQRALDEELQESAPQTQSVSRAHAYDERQESDFNSAHDISLATATLPTVVHDDWEEDFAAENEKTADQSVAAQGTADDAQEQIGTDRRENAQPTQTSELADSAQTTPAAQTGNSAQTGATDVPQSGANVDVAPSYSSPSQQITKPSTTELAQGNMVLTEAEVVSRLSGVQEKLFGANGSARDVSTVLIRVRALGSYYDALTHVREGGFWKQQRTFDLIPEDVLNVLQLKADSYKEGFGSPLSMSLRFTPGIPPVAEFNYASEGAFAKYSDELPAQQYVEELRMFPRTGANIPEHMSRALSSWTL
ncbi:MAG: hypothetical protein Q3974_09615 [Rothia sp. (in: high G+C Gram-positive bacteria)]|nr:hypothetical protein [Rothia sp. (in: high G+C Gram-positive bacteria)]